MSALGMKFPSFRSKQPQKEEGDDAQADPPEPAQAGEPEQQAQAQQPVMQPPPPQEPPAPQEPPPADSKEEKPKKKGFFSRGKKEKEEREAEADKGAPSPPQQPSEPQPTPSDEKPKKKGLFSRKEPKAPKQPKEEKDAQPEQANEAKKRRFGFRRSKKLVDSGPAPTELVAIDGEKVLVPTYEDIEKFGSIVYPVREPYQFVNLHYETGELT